MSALDELPNLGSEEFDRLCEVQKLEWLEELLKAVEDAGGVLAGPSPELSGQWQHLTGHSEQIIPIGEGGCPRSAV